MQQEIGGKEMDMVGSAIEIASAWLFGLMVFFVNPLNDATDPASTMNYYYSKNVKIREAVRKSYGGNIHTEWQEMVPYIYSGFVSILGWIMMRVTAFFVAG